MALAVNNGKYGQAGRAKNYDDDDEDKGKARGLHVSTGEISARKATDDRRAKLITNRLIHITLPLL